MRIVWSLPVRGETLTSARGDLVRARALIAALRAAGHKVLVVEDGATPAARGRVRAYRSIVKRVLPSLAARTLRDLFRIPHGRAHARRVAAVARAHDADLIVETQVHFSDSGAIAARLTGLPLILDDCSPVTEEATLGCALPTLARRAFDTQVACASAIVVPSHVLAECLAAGGVPRALLRVVPNGVDIEAYDANGARTRERHGNERITLVFAGSFQPWHRAEMLLEAVQLLADPRLQLLLLGDGPGRPTALSTARRLGLNSRLAAPGALPPAMLAGALTHCDIGVLPASNEYGHPMKLLDYAAARLAIIAPDLAPVREVLRHGETGLLFRPGDVTDLAARIHVLAADAELRARLGAAARLQIAETGSWQVRARALVEDARVPGARPSPSPERESLVVSASC